MTQTLHRTPGGFIYMVRTDYSDPATEADWNRWYTEQHVPDMFTVPGWLSSRRYRAVSEGQPRYLTLHELASLDVFGSPAHKKVAGWGPFEDRITNFSRGFFELMSAHEK